MIKSLALTSIVCALNMGGSFNIQPKEVTWTDNVSQIQTNISNENYISRSDTQDGAVTLLYIKNISQYNDQYVTIKNTTITQVRIAFSKQNDEYILSNDAIRIINKSITEIDSFSQNADIYNAYPKYDIFTGFNDNKGTQYNFTIVSSGTNQVRRYNNTNETQEALLEIKQADEYNEIATSLTDFDIAINDTTTNNPTYSNITNYVNQTKIEIEDEGISSINKVFYYAQTQAKSQTLSIVYNGNTITTNEEITEWIENFYETIEGVNTFNWNLNGTTKKELKSTISLNVDTGTATTSEVIDIGGLMWDIIGMPFTFINMAFNVTLFPGTIYEFNIGTLFKGLIAILAILFVIKLFTRGIDVIGAYTGSAQDTRFKRENQQMKREKHQMDKEKHAKDMAKKE